MRRFVGTGLFHCLLRRLCLISIGGLFLASCGLNQSNNTTTNATLSGCQITASAFVTNGAQHSVPPATPALRGASLTIDGSTALQPLLQQAAVEMNAVNAMHIVVTGGGSTQGLHDVETGTVDMGMSDIFAEEASPSHSYTDLIDHPVATVTFTLVVSGDVRESVRNLRLPDIQAIFLGHVTNWKQLGGPDEPITVFNRTAGSGTRATFEHYILGSTNERQRIGMQADSMQQEITAIAAGKGAIGYTATNYVESVKGSNGVSPICIDGFGATAHNVSKGYYPFWSYEHVYTKGKPSAIEQAFLNYVMSEAFQSTDLIELGYQGLAS